jgi:hypothetical protein
MSSVPALDPRPVPKPVGAGFRLTVFALALVVSLGYVVVRSRTEAAALARLGAQLDVATLENKRLSEVKYWYERVEKKKNAHQNSALVIQKLLSVQWTPAPALQTLDQALRRSPGVSLQAVDVAFGRAGARIELHGRTQTPATLGNFKRELEQSGKFDCSLQAPGANDGQGGGFALECLRASGAKP